MQRPTICTNKNIEDSRLSYATIMMYPLDTHLITIRNVF
jgi:hypothetical protein